MAPLSVAFTSVSVQGESAGPSPSRHAPPPTSSGHKVMLSRSSSPASSKSRMMLALARAMMSPPSWRRSRRTVAAGLR
jgi:hypothetical protein